MEIAGLGPIAGTVGITLRRRKPGEGICQEKAGRQEARPYQDARTFHLWTPYAFQLVRKHYPQCRRKRTQARVNNSKSVNKGKAPVRNVNALAKATECHVFRSTLAIT